MDAPRLPRRIPEAVMAGRRAAFSRTFTEADVALFVGVTWDVNPYHTNETFAAATKFKHRIVPGLLTASLLTHMGGLWAFLATEMHFEFLAPVYVGDTVTAEVEVAEVNHSRGWAKLRCRCTRGETEVLRGEITGFPGRSEE